MECGGGERGKGEGEERGKTCGDGCVVMVEGANGGRERGETEGRERERLRHRDRQTDRQTDRDR